VRPKNIQNMDVEVWTFEVQTVNPWEEENPENTEEEE
jgi:hypothetical protein